MPQRELFTLQDETFAAIPLAAAPLATLAGFVRVFDLAFIGWRWAGLAESLHQLHAQHESYQRVNTFALDHFFFNEAMQIVPATSTSTETPG